MVHIHAIAAGHLEWVMYAVSLLAGALPEEILSIRMRGFGGRGCGMRRGSFRLSRILFVLLFPTALGSVVLFALFSCAASWFPTNRRGR